MTDNRVAPALPEGRRAVAYALRDYIGEDKVDRALRGFLAAHRFTGPPYPTSLELVDSLAARGTLEDYPLLSAVRAELLRRLGRREDALDAYRAAHAAARLEPDRRLLARRIAELEQIR